MILLNQGMTPEERLFTLVNAHPQYSALWHESHLKDAELLIDSIREQHGLQGIVYSLLFTKREVEQILGH